MKMSDSGIEWLKKLEGAIKINGRHVIYNDMTGKPILTNEGLPVGSTIGYGHLIKPEEDFYAGLTESQATELLCLDIIITEKALYDFVRTTMLQHQYDALVGLVFNIGVKKFKSSTLLKYINNPNFRSEIYLNKESAWKAWNKSRGHISAGLKKKTRCRMASVSVFGLQRLLISRNVTR